MELEFCNHYFFYPTPRFNELFWDKFLLGIPWKLQHFIGRMFPNLLDYLKIIVNSFPQTFIYCGSVRIRGENTLTCDYEIKKTHYILMFKIFYSYLQGRITNLKNNRTSGITFLTVFEWSALRMVPSGDTTGRLMESWKASVAIFDIVIPSRDEWSQFISVRPAFVIMSFTVLSNHLTINEETSF